MKIELLNRSGNIVSSTDATVLACDGEHVPWNGVCRITGPGKRNANEIRFPPIRPGETVTSYRIDGGEPILLNGDLSHATLTITPVFVPGAMEIR